ncbi:glycosyltransferase [Oceaniglobus roseus]|uniref:glycosyltransferase n=1 Tax=Oceaniglobus roseus TaxID=1737570 RepID=UPI001FEB5F98|nr:glycosyltransferase [Kandeliimicrobium roseum]
MTVQTPPFRPAGDAIARHDAPGSKEPAPMNPSKIVVINDTSLPRGGTANLALLALRHLRARGVAAHWVCGDDGANPEFAELGVPVTAAHQSPLLERGRVDAARAGAYNTPARDMLARYIVEHDDPDTVYHLHGWAQILSPSVFSALAPVAERVFVHAHDMFLACPNGVYMDYRKGEVCTRRPLGLDCVTTNCDKRAYHHKLWRVARHAMLRRTFAPELPWAGVFQIHPDMQSRLERGGIPGRFCRTLRNPADPYSATRIRAEENGGLLYVGRLEADKGVLALARAARRTGAAVTFVGEGTLRATLEAEYPEFPVTGWKSRDEIGAIAAGMRALVMPSLHPEPFALVLPEAIHSGLPVLVAQTALMSREIAARGLGLSFDASDDAAFDAALRAIAALPPARLREMSEAGFAGDARLALSVDEWVSGLLDAYRGAVLRQRPAE